MSNEALLIGFIFANLAIVLACFKGGRRWLEAYIIIATVTIYCIAGKLFDFFGLPVNATAATYAGIFLATDMITERYGKKYGFRMIRIGFFSAILFMFITQFALLMTPLSDVQGLSDAMNTVFGTSLRIFIGSVTAYLVAQHFDVWFYHFLNQKTGGRFLWLRNNVSTVTSQFIDSVIFFTIAFYGVIPNIVEVVLVGWLMKVAVAVLDTPFMYLSKKITPLDLRDDVYKGLDQTSG